jgi:hypothetical protein
MEGCCPSHGGIFKQQYFCLAFVRTVPRCAAEFARACSIAAALHAAYQPGVCAQCCLKFVCPHLILYLVIGSDFFVQSAVFSSDHVSKHVLLWLQEQLAA